MIDLTKYGFMVAEHASPDGYVDVRGSMADVFRFFRAAQAGEVTHQLRKDNQGTFDDFLFDNSGNEWRGGTSDELINDLAGNVDLKPYEEAKRKIEKSDLITNIRTNMQDVKPKRKRFSDPEEGDWEYDRRHMDKPFMRPRRIRANVPKVLEIMCGFSCRGSVPRSDINSFGALVWSVVQIIENCGVVCRLNWMNRIVGVATSGDLKIRPIIRMKDFHEYISPTSLAAMMSARYYRRGNFALNCAITDHKGFRHDSGAGSSMALDNAIKFEDGRLWIGTKMMRTTGYEALEREVFKALGMKEPQPVVVRR